MQLDVFRTGGTESASESLSEAAARAVSGWEDGCTTWAPAWAVAMASGYVISYIADAVLIRVSASLSMLNYVLIATVTTAVYLIPGVNPAASKEATPYWSVIISVLLSAVGLTMWTRWENEYDAEAAYTVLTPKRREVLAGGGASRGIDDGDGTDNDYLCKTDD
jgi:hypothetical protein